MPEEFVDNFIIGITDFSTMKGQSVFDFNWEFDRELKTIQVESNSTNSTNATYINSTYEAFGVRISASIPKPGLGKALTRQGITLFYIKTWYCPDGYFFDIDSDRCTICLVDNCLLCDNLTFCYQCDEQNNYYLNNTNGQC